MAAEQEIRSIPKFSSSRNVGKILKTLNTWRARGDYCDVIFSFYDKHFAAHSCVVAAASPYLKILLEGKTQSKSWPYSEISPVVIEVKLNNNIDDLCAEIQSIHSAMEVLLTFIYTSMMEIKLDLLPIVEQIAKMFELDDVVKFCDKMVKKQNLSINAKEVIDKSLNCTMKKPTRKLKRRELIACAKTGPSVPYKKKKMKDKQIKSQNKKLDNDTCDNDIHDDINSLPIVDKPDNDNDNEMNDDMCGFNDDKLNNFSVDTDTSCEMEDNIYRDRPTDILLPSGSDQDIPKGARAFIQNGTISSFYHNVISICMKQGTKHGQGQNLIHHRCVKCHRKSSAYTGLLNHQTVHTGGVFTCEKCEKEFPPNQLVPFRQHLREHLKHPNQCSWLNCEFISDDQNLLSRHSVKHSGLAPHVCLICDKRFKQSRGLSEHSRVHSEDRAYECKICAARFKQNGPLVNHMLTHSDDRPHLCDICGFSSKYKQKLQEHYRLHTGDFIQCPVEGCSYRTYKTVYLKRHELVHTKARLYMCDECGKSFYDSNVLKRHKRIHTGETPYSCDYCSFACARRDKLKHHIRTIHSAF